MDKKSLAGLCFLPIRFFEESTEILEIGRGLSLSRFISLSFVGLFIVSVLKEVVTSILVFSYYPSYIIVTLRSAF
uniref:Defensin-like protein n=1 Tax=Datura stramonium TaxID=4076 RepID=A0A125QWU9_DATST|nr:defensin-like protein [Datura stramonium]